MISSIVQKTALLIFKFLDTLNCKIKVREVSRKGSMKISIKHLFGVSILGIILLLSICAYWHTQKVAHLQSALQNLHQKIEDLANKSAIPATTANPNNYDTAVASQLWAKMQKKLQNTVVQLFVTSLEKNILQPYKVPKVNQCTGSGFIINDQGEIITNAHVVNGATSIMVQMTAFGKHRFEVDLVGIMPEKDIAMVKFKPEDLDLIIKALGKMPTLPLGDSDTVERSQEILALGYPLGQESLKSTTGVISGRESGRFQISAPINPGNSGGPSINCNGEVIGINSSGVLSAQNVGYIIPINEVKTFLDDLRAGGLVRKPYIGIYQSIATPDLVKALGNPMPGGTYVVDVLPDSPLYQQLKPGDMIYSINGTPIDLYGEVSVPWSEDKISTAEYISRIKVGQKVTLSIYRRGKKMEFSCNFERKKLAPIRHVFAEYEELPFQAFGGFIIMPLMINHLPLLIQQAPSLAKYTEDKHQFAPELVITHVLPDSPAFKARHQVLAGSILKLVNNKPVKTLEEFNKALAQSGPIITLETTDNILIALDTQKVCQTEATLAQKNNYTITSCMEKLMKKYGTVA